ncbi:MAG: hypothetical protein IT532_07050 [Burkholderiales bacterium]|nr:hypothetical protein [Burkholderiales bacterium]
MRILHILDHSIPAHRGYTFRTLAILREQPRLGWVTIHLTAQRIIGLVQQRWRQLRATARQLIDTDRNWKNSAFGYENVYARCLARNPADAGSTRAHEHTPPPRLRPRAIMTAPLGR